MKQIFFFGSSIIYGVGSEYGGIADRLKRELGEVMFGSNGVGEKYEIFNFAKSGATIEFVGETFETQYSKYRRDCENLAVLSVGMGNTRAVDTEFNYISDETTFETLINDLLACFSNSFDNTIFLSHSYVDEDKTYPKENPLAGGKSYFSNNRILQFSELIKEAAKTNNISYVDLLSNVNKDEWIAKSLSNDGIHPNNNGHEIIYSMVRPYLDSIIDD